MVDVQFYENRHLTFKQEFNRTSKRRTSVQKETINRVQGRISRMELINGREGIINNEKSCGLSGRGTNLKLIEFKGLVDFMNPRLENSEKRIEKTILNDARKIYDEKLIKLFNQVGDQGARVLLKTIDELLDENDLHWTKTSLHIEVVKSGIVNGGHICSLDDIDNRISKITTVQRTGIMWQRYIACDGYYKTGNRRYSFVIVKGLSLIHI